MTIRSFGAVRPNPHRVILKEGVYVPDGSSIGSFCIERPSENFISLMGIKTPGITCADQLGEYLAKETAAYLQASRKDSFDPIRTGIPKGSDEVLCQCEQISKSEVLEAIRRGAKTLDGIKRRVGSGMGRCQGSRCSYEIRKILEEWQNENL
jgi:glycerol-3-phosphate dehydrogenase